MTEKEIEGIKNLIWCLIASLILPLSSFAADPITLNYGGAVKTVAFSPVDASLIASAGNSNIIKLWNLEKDTVVTLKGHTDTVNSVAFSADGEILASASDDGYLKLWDVSSLQNIKTLTHILDGFRWRVKEVAFSPDGKYLASVVGKYIRLWDPVKHTEFLTLSYDQWVQAVAFSPDSKFMASGDGSNAGPGTIYVYDIQNQSVPAKIEADEKQVHAVAFSPDGQILAGSGVRGQIRMWNTSDWSLVHQTPYQGHHHIEFSPDGSVLASAGHDSVSLFSVQGGNKIASLKGSTGVNHPISFSSDGKLLAAGGEDGVIRVWNVEAYLRQTMIRLTYFLPRGRRIQQDIDTKLDELIKDAQQFYAEQLGRHGFTRKTFTFESDANGKAVVRHVAGQFANSHYRENTFDKVWRELSERFERQPHIVNLVVLDIDTGAVSVRDDVFVCGVASFDHGISLIPASGHCFNAVNAVHELGHAFGLQHDFRDDAYIMSYGANRTQLSKCAGEWLNNSPFFNDVQADKQVNTNTTIQMHNPISVSVNTMQLRFEIADADGLYQAQLAIPASAEDPAIGLKLHSCRALNGQTDVEFVTKDLIIVDEVALQVMDSYGNIIERVFSIQLEERIVDTEPPPITADVNDDGTVNLLDLIFVGYILENEVPDLTADVNGDGVVSIQDLVLVAVMFGNTVAAPSASSQVPETLTAVEVQQWLTNARDLGVKDAIMRRGIMVLEQLLISLTPTETELLSNYPNPFNPETWIPYSLAADAEVQIAIYDTKGTLVRQFDLGHQEAGYYTDRARATYWDGQNAAGESVASGVYFYHLRAGDFTATWRMVILK